MIGSHVDDLRPAFRGSLGPTFVLATFVYWDRRWVPVARSTVRARVDGLATTLGPLTFQPFVVIEVPTDPEDIDFICGAVEAIADPEEAAEMADHPWSLSRSRRGVR